MIEVFAIWVINNTEQIVILVIAAVSLYNLLKLTRSSLPGDQEMSMVIRKSRQIKAQADQDTITFIVQEMKNSLTVPRKAAPGKLERIELFRSRIEPSSEFGN